MCKCVPCIYSQITQCRSYQLSSLADENLSDFSCNHLQSEPNEEMNTTNVTIPPLSSEHWVSVTTWKCITALAMFLSVFIVLLLPVLVVNRFDLRRQNSSYRNNFTLWVGRLSCFAAGVFLSTGFMDIFPDVIGAIKEAAVKLNLKIAFPLASFFTLLGFFLILSIEQIIFFYNESVRAKTKDDNDAEEIQERLKRNESSQVLISKDTEISDQLNTKSRTNNLGKTKSHSVDSNTQDNEHFSEEEEGGQERNHDDHNSILHHSKSRIIALMSAISVHAIFEGFAIGLGTTLTGVTQLFLALSLHKLIIAGSLGLNLATAKLKLWFKILVSFLFAMGSPLGIMAGIVVMGLESSGNKVFYMVGGALEGLACGTFLYVVFFEILPHQMGHHSKEDRGGKLTGLLLGFILICLFLLFVEKN